MSLNDISLACQWWPNIKCWLGSFVIFPALLRKPIFLWFFRGGPDPPVPLWIRKWALCPVLLNTGSTQEYQRPECATTIMPPGSIRLFERVSRSLKLIKSASMVTPLSISLEASCYFYSASPAWLLWPLNG